VILEHPVVLWIHLNRVNLECLVDRLLLADQYYLVLQEIPEDLQIQWYQVILDHLVVLLNQEILEYPVDLLLPEIPEHLEGLLALEDRWPPEDL
jgi:hypothetical protein